MLFLFSRFVSVEQGGINTLDLDFHHNSITNIIPNHKIGLNSFFLSNLCTSLQFLLITFAFIRSLLVRLCHLFSCKFFCLIYFNWQVKLNRNFVASRVNLDPILSSFYLGYVLYFLY